MEASPPGAPIAGERRESPGSMKRGRSVPGRTSRTQRDERSNGVALASVAYSRGRSPNHQICTKKSEDTPAPRSSAGLRMRMRATAPLPTMGERAAAVSGASWIDSAAGELPGTCRPASYWARCSSSKRTV